jgi:hypothetical protein
MLEYSDFYNIAEYGNVSWKGSFSAREIAENAYIYYSDFQWSKKNEKVSHVIQELAKLLAEDGSDECKDWLYDIAKELELTDMEYWEYCSYNVDMLSCFLAEKETENEITTISGIIFQHGADDFGLWEGFVLSEEDENAIWKILQKYETEGCSVRGTRKEIAYDLV